ncbi:MAG: hypothetical protein FJ104_05040, partial [Deltaproteobacteria bacterium]|nr:hypothetical protein [Deltaproteobacteria bacterium]
MRADDHSLTIRRWPVDSIERATGALVDGVLRRNALGLLAKLRRGSIIVVDAGEQWVFGAPGDPLTVTLTVHDPAGYRAMLLGGSVGVGEAYVQGHWTCDDLPKLARILAQNLDLLGAMDRGAPRLVRRVTQRIVA